MRSLVSMKKVKSLEPVTIDDTSYTAVNIDNGGTTFDTVASETMISSMLGKTRAIDAVHQTLVDTLETVQSNAVAEGADYTMKTRTTPTRLSNIVEQVAVPFSVTRTQQAIDHYHGTDELTRQETKALKEYGNSVEFDLLRSTLVSGASGTTPKMEGIIAHISKSTNTTAQTSGVAWSASILKGLMKANWENSNGEVATDIFMGSYLKDKTDDFTNKTNVTYTSGDQTSIVNVVDVLTIQAHIKFGQMLETLKDIITYKVKILCMNQWTISRKDIMVGSLA